MIYCINFQKALDKSRITMYNKAIEKTATAL